MNEWNVTQVPEMTWTGAIKRCLQEKYADFNGRASRSEFWKFTISCWLFNSLVQILLGPFAGDGSAAAETIPALISLALLLPSLAVGVRRLHDTGRTGWWLLIGLVPIIGLYLLYCYLQGSQCGANKYGPQPPETLA